MCTLLCALCCRGSAAQLFQARNVLLNALNNDNGFLKGNCCVGAMAGVWTLLSLGVEHKIFKLKPSLVQLNALGMHGYMIVTILSQFFYPVDGSRNEHQAIVRVF